MTKQDSVQSPRVAFVDERACIGCTLCIEACPVDAIVGASHRMHTVIAAECTGCGWCLPPCPVDCISLVESGEPFTGEQRRQRAVQYRQRRLARAERRRAEQPEAKRSEDTDPLKRAVIERAMQRARQRLRDRSR